MKVVHYLSRLNRDSGGLLRAVIDLCSALGKEGLDVRLVHRAPEPSWLEPNENYARFTLEGQPGWGGRLGAHELTHLESILRSADVVHLHTPWDITNLQVSRLCRASRVPYVLTTHGMLDDWSMSVHSLKKRTYLQLFARQLITAAATLHMTAEEELRQSAPRTFGTPVAVLPLPLDPVFDDPLPGPELASAWLRERATPAPCALFLSRLHPKKGPELAIDALALLEREGIQASLVLAGPGDSGYVQGLKERARGASVTERCHFVGSVHGSLKLSLLQFCDVLLLPTAQENFGLVIPEALAAGLPVITTRNVAIWRELEGSGAVELVERNPDAFARALRTFSETPELWRSRSEKGQQFARKTFARAPIATRYQALYRKIGNSPRV